MKLEDIGVAIFPSQFERDGTDCPICKSQEQKPAVFVKIAGTQDGGNVEAIVVHLDCLLDNAWGLRGLEGELIMIYCHTK